MWNILYFCWILKRRFVDRFFENTQISNFMKILSVGAELFHADVQTDRQTDRVKLVVAFRNFSNSPKIATHASQSLPKSQILSCLVHNHFPPESISPYPVHRRLISSGPAQIWLTASCVLPLTNALTPLLSALCPIFKEVIIHSFLKLLC
jgi:hypothetical protein